MADCVRRRTVLSGLAAGAGTGLAGCLDEVPGMGERDVTEFGGTDRELRLAILQPTSGDLGDLGTPIAQAAELPVTQVTDDVEFSFDVETWDTETSPSTGVQAALEIADEGYPAVNGPAASGSVLQVAQQVLIPYRIVSCTPSGTSPTISVVNDAGLLHRTAVSDALQSVVLAERAVEDLGHTTAATLYVNNDYGFQLSREFTQAFENEHGGTVTDQVPFEGIGEDDEDPDPFDDEFEAARRGDPELLVIIGYPASGVQLFTDYYRTDGDESVLVTDGLREGGLQDQVGEAISEQLDESVEDPIDGFRGTAPVAAGPGADVFTDLFEDEYEEPPGQFTAHAYDATAVLLLANAYAGQNDGQAIANAMGAVTGGGGEEVGPENLAEGLELAGESVAVEYQGASSAVNFDENGDMEDATFEYWEYDSTADGGIAELDRVNV